MKDLRQRLISALVFATIVIGGMLIHEIGFHLLFISLQIIAIKEYFFLQEEASKRPMKNDRLFITAVSLAIYITSALFVHEIIAIKYFICFALIPILVICQTMFSGSKDPIRKSGQNLLALLYITIPMNCALFIAFYGDSFSGALILSILVLNWIYDTAAYFAGTTFGKHPLAPKISPKKSVEGLIGGMIFTIGLAVPLGVLNNNLDTIDWLILAILVTIFGTLGDLSESMMKRRAEVKDSGTIMPGHGGVLDRFDAFLMILPACAIYLFVIS